MTACASRRPNTILIYGKLAKFWKNSEKLLESLHSSNFEIHATIDESIDDGKDLKHIPDFVINHGILDSVAYAELLSEMRFFLGLGFPYDGPAAMEAISAGLVFIQPKIHVTREISDFFKDKPNDRELTSQHSYLEKFVGEPRVWTIDYGVGEGNEVNFENFENVKNLMVKLRDDEKIGFDGLVPYEFSAAGMLERFFIQIQSQNFCVKNWDSINTGKIENHYSVNIGYLKNQEIKILKAKSETDNCDETCEKEGLICDITSFGSIKDGELENFCDSSESVDSLKNLKTYGFSLPIVKETEDKRHCILNKNKSDQAFSCSFKNKYNKNLKSSNKNKFYRICACSTKSITQNSLCKKCTF